MEPFKLSDNQYSSSEKYEARIYLHRKFRTNPLSKYEWIFEHFPKNENLNVLELGCGTGLFWLANRNNIIKSWTIILSDYSEGMLQTTRDSLSRISKLNINFQYEIVNAENIEFPDNNFDIILANNMLYHIPNRDAAIKNIHRILKDTGIFIASTMGKNDLAELNNHFYTFLESKNNKLRFLELSFSLNNGLEQLAEYFEKIVLEKYNNSLEIDEIDAIVNYYLSFNGIYNNVVVLPEEYINDFKIYLQNVLEKEKTIVTTKDEGIFICEK
jgi:ubiquinone/menaquinone biosynthesis C-methylase UbiE